MTGVDVELLVIVPSRGRPENIAALCDTWEATSTGRAALLVALDDDDPTIADYGDVILHAAPTVPIILSVTERAGFAPRLNAEALERAGQYPYLASWGDDHRPRTAGWDTRLCAALDRLGTGVAYGNDLVHGEAIPTAWAQTSDIVSALGWMTPPGLRHMYVDNAIRDLGVALDRCTYLPDVVIEHVHPITGQVPDDPLYREAASMMGADHDVYRAWLHDGLAGDVATVRERCQL